MSACWTARDGSLDHWVLGPPAGWIPRLVTSALTSAGLSRPASFVSLLPAVGSSNLGGAITALGGARLGMIAVVGAGRAALGSAQLGMMALVGAGRATLGSARLGMIVVVGAVSEWAVLFGALSGLFGSGGILLVGLPC